jgi:hypothetical protein
MRSNLQFKSKRGARGRLLRSPTNQSLLVLRPKQRTELCGEYFPDEELLFEFDFSLMLTLFAYFFCFAWTRPSPCPASPLRMIYIYRLFI